MLVEIKPGPEIDTGRVDAIRSQLDENTYDLDPQQIADKFIDLEAEIFGYN